MLQKGFDDFLLLAACSSELLLFWVLFSFASQTKVWPVDKHHSASSGGWEERYPAA